MREHSATALVFMVVLNGHSQSFLRQNLAIGRAPKPVRSDFLFTYQNGRFANIGLAGCTELFSPIIEIIGNIWHYSERHSFVHCTQEIGCNHYGQFRGNQKVKSKIDIPTATNWTS